MVAIVMLLWAIYPENPYGYYILLRIVVWGIFIYTAVMANDTPNRELWAWPFGFTAIVYNPIIRVHLP